MNRMGLMAVLVSLVMAGAACEREEGISLAVEETPCSRPGVIEVQLTHDALVVSGNTIIDVNDGRIDDALVNRSEKTIIPLYNLLAKFREIETRHDLGDSVVVVQVVEPVPDESVDLVRATIDKTGYPYHIRKKKRSG